MKKNIWGHRQWQMDPEGGLLLPRRDIILPKTKKTFLQAPGAGYFGGSAAVRARVQLRFEDSPGFLVDQGLAASTWTASGYAATTTAGFFKEGVKGARSNVDDQVSGNYIHTLATSGNCINGTHDGCVIGWFTFGSDGAAGSGPGGAFVGNRISPYDGATTGILGYVGGSAYDAFGYWGNGSSVLNAGVNTTDRRNAQYNWCLEQYSVSGTPKMFLYVAGTCVNPGGTATGGAIPIPTGSYLTLGTVYSGSRNYAVAVDSFQVFDFSLFAGASSFIPPVIET